MKDIWLLFIPYIWLNFFCDAYYIKSNKKLEYELYEVEKEELRVKNELAKIMPERFVGVNLEDTITVPSPEFSLPLLYYLIFTALYIVGRLFFFS